MGMRAKEGGEVNKWRAGGADLVIQACVHLFGFFGCFFL